MPRGSHPNSRKNLVPPIELGEIRNPRGSRRPDTADRLLREISDEKGRYVDPLSGKRRNMPHREKIARELIDRACKGQPHAMKLYLERTGGLPTMKLEQEGPHDKVWENIRDFNHIMGEMAEDMFQKKQRIEAKVKKAKGPVAKKKALDEW